MRYTLVIKSPTGAMNVTYEGMRCATDGKRESARLDLLILKFQVTEKRLYAIGRDDETWVGHGDRNGRNSKMSPSIMPNERLPDISSARLIAL